MVHAFIVVGTVVSVAYWSAIVWARRADTRRGNENPLTSFVGQLVWPLPLGLALIAFLVANSTRLTRLPIEARAPESVEQFLRALEDNEGGFFQSCYIGLPMENEGVWEQRETNEGQLVIDIANPSELQLPESSKLGHSASLQVIIYNETPYPTGLKLSGHAYLLEGIYYVEAVRMVELETSIDVRRLPREELLGKYRGVSKSCAQG